VNAWYFGTDAAGHIPADSICDVRLQVITMHRVLHIFYIGENILSTSSALDVLFVGSCCNSCLARLTNS